MKSPPELVNGAGLMKIGELSGRTGLSRQTLNHYLLLGLLQEEARTPSGRCLFARSALDRLARIEALKRQDRTLKEIRECLEEAP